MTHDELVSKRDYKIAYFTFHGLSSSALILTGQTTLIMFDYIIEIFEDIT